MSYQTVSKTLILLYVLAASISGADGSTKKTSSPPISLQITSPKSLAVGTQGTLEILISGRQSKNGIVITTGCDVGYSIYNSVTGREVLRYPGKQPCPEQLYRIPTIKGSSTLFKLPILTYNGRSPLPKGQYKIKARLTPVIDNKGLKRLTSITSDSVDITIK
ncbi:hypothetical protein [Deinococcus wulumuqiensis]|uniref:hypothetical protein n=1 Tax=Deinococcus wulumuqiensis TaxID=980427 RepID=UPI0013C32FFA|nr:hypothetical protein [Deinococcus wulumuqiensis]